MISAMEGSSSEPRQHDGHRVGWSVQVGVLSVLIGITAVVIANHTHLTVIKAITGGVHIKDSYRLALQYGGYALVGFAQPHVRKRSGS